jgi:hypothetical protein
MNNAADRQTGGGDPDATLADVSGMSFEAVLKEESAFGRALSRLMRETDSDEDFYAAFGNFAPEPPGPPTVAARNA